MSSVSAYWIPQCELLFYSFFTPSFFFSAPSLYLLHTASPALFFLSFLPPRQSLEYAPPPVCIWFTCVWMINEWLSLQIYTNVCKAYPPPSPCHPPFSTWHPHKWNAIKTRKRKMKKKTFDAKSWKLIALPLPFPYSFALSLSAL